MKKSLSMVITFFLCSTIAAAQEIIVLGAPGRGGELGTPGGILEGPDGNIYIYDESDALAGRV